MRGWHAMGHQFRACAWNMPIIKPALAAIILIFFSSVDAAMPVSHYGEVAGQPYNVTMHSYDVIVVGLGCAGIAAATTLAKAGRKVLGLEAMDRIGGRVHTIPYGDGVVEVGAEWIHGIVNSSTYKLAMQHNITIIPQDPTFNVFRSDGTAENNEVLNDLINYSFNLIGIPQTTYDESLGQYITSRLMNYVKSKYPELYKDQVFLDEFIQFLNLYLSIHEGANDWNEVTTQSEYRDLLGHQHMSWHRYGYRTLFDLMLNTYENGTGLPNLDIKLNAEVIEIKWPKDGGDVRVVCADGSTHASRHVIVTVSLGVLKDRYITLFKPELPIEKIEAIENMSIGAVNKVIFKYEKRWWPENVMYYGFVWKPEDKVTFAKEDWWMTKVFGASNPEGATNTLTWWIGGDVAKLLEILPEEIVMRKCTELLRKFMGHYFNITEPTGMIRSSWYSNPFTRGSYTFDNRLSALYPNARPTLAEPLRDSLGVVRVLFAGEATNAQHFSTAHGAVESGYREAMRLINSKF